MGRPSPTADAPEIAPSLPLSSRPHTATPSLRTPTPPGGGSASSGGSGSGGSHRRLSRVGSAGLAALARQIAADVQHAAPATPHAPPPAIVEVSPVDRATPAVASTVADGAVGGDACLSNGRRVTPGRLRAARGHAASDHGVVTASKPPRLPPRVARSAAGSVCSAPPTIRASAAATTTSRADDGRVPMKALSRASSAGSVRSAVSASSAASDATTTASGGKRRAPVGAATASTPHAPSMWHAAVARVEASDGGRLRLWRALREKARSRSGSEGARWVREAPVEAEDVCSVLFDELGRACDEAPPPPIARPLVERLFEACSSTMINREGGRELLLPLLKVAATHAGLPRDELRALVNLHAFPDGNGAKRRWGGLSLATRLAARPTATGTMADGGQSAVSLAAIARAATERDLTERMLATPTPSEPVAADAETSERRETTEAPRAPLSPPSEASPAAAALPPPRCGEGAAQPSAAAPRSRWSLVQAAIVPSVVVAARRGEEKMFPDGPASWMRTGSGGRPARPPSAALRDAIQPMNLDARLAEDGRFAS